MDGMKDLKAATLGRHAMLRRLARSVYKAPKMRSASRVLARLLIQKSALSLKNKQRIFNFLAEDTAPNVPVRFTCPTPCSNGRALELELDIRDDLSRKFYHWGFTGYERGTVRLFTELLKTKTCVFDIGANIGFYTLLAASALEGRGTVHAFEPHPKVFRWLAHNVGLNGFEAVNLRQAALSDVDGYVPLFIPLDNAWTNASLVEGFTEQKESVSAESVRLDSYCANNFISKVDLIKIDVEGAEVKVFKGMGDMLNSSRPDIICEVLPPYEDELEDIFKGTQYRKFLITDDDLVEMRQLKAHLHYRDYYLSCNPLPQGKFDN